MKIEYLYEAGPFGSYKNKRSPEDDRKAVAKDLTHVVKSALLERLHTKIEVLIKEYLDKNYKLQLDFNKCGLSLVGKKGNKRGVYGGWDGLEGAIPVFRLALENNTVVVIMSCVPYDNNKIIVRPLSYWFGWINSLKKYLNSIIDKITETGLPFNYDGFDVKLEIDPDILDNDGRASVDLMSIMYIDDINKIQDFVDHFYNQDIRIKTRRLLFFNSMTSNKMYQQFIDRFPYLVRCTDYITLDMNAMKNFDLENLNIISVLADPHSDVEVHYELKTNETGASLKGIEKFINNEYNISLEKFKEIAYQNKSPLRSPKNVRLISVSYKYNNPSDIEIKAM